MNVCGKYAFLFCLLLLLIPPVRAQAPEPADAFSTRGNLGGPIIAAVYQNWWNGTCDQKPLKPVGGYYNNQVGLQASETIYQHAQYALKHGIDAFIFEWSGRIPGAEDEIIFDRVIPVMDSLAHDKVPFRFALTYNSGLAFARHGFGLDPWNHLHLASGANAVRSKITGKTSVEQVASDIGVFCEYANHQQYLHIDGRPVLYLLGYSEWVGEIGPAIWGGEEACLKAIGKKPYIVGVFPFSPRVYPKDHERLWYNDKAKIVSAISNNWLFDGYGIPSEADSTLQFVNSKYWPCDSPSILPPWKCRTAHGNTRLGETIRNAFQLSGESLRPYFPGFSPQFFSSPSTKAPSCSVNIVGDDPNTRYMPLARWIEGDVTEKSRLAMEKAMTSLLYTNPKVLIVTAFNSPANALMVEPSVNSNLEGYTMQDDFFIILRRLIASLCKTGRYCGSGGGGGAS